MRPFLMLLALLLIAPAASAQAAHALQLNVAPGQETLDDRQSVPIHIEVTRICSHQAMVLDPTPVHFQIAAPSDLIVQIGSGSFPQQICAIEMEQRTSVTGTLLRDGGDGGIRQAQILAFTESTGPLTGSAESPQIAFSVVFNGTDAPASTTLDEAPTADTPFPALAAPLGLAAAALLRRRS